MELFISSIIILCSLLFLFHIYYTFMHIRHQIRSIMYAIISLLNVFLNIILVLYLFLGDKLHV